jgi:hypothetical protein
MSMGGPVFHGRIGPGATPLPARNLGVWPTRKISDLPTPGILRGQEPRHRIGLRKNRKPVLPRHGSGGSACTARALCAWRIPLRRDGQALTIRTGQPPSRIRFEPDAAAIEAPSRRRVRIQRSLKTGMRNRPIAVAAGSLTVRPSGVRHRCGGAFRAGKQKPAKDTLCH